MADPCLLAEKWDRPYSEMVGYVRGRMGIAIIRSNMVLLRGDWVHKQTLPWVWDDAEYEAVREQNAGDKRSVFAAWPVCGKINSYQ